ncbi:MAG TPA: phosphatase PAP2 family protein [Methylophilus sp.]
MRAWRQTSPASYASPSWAKRQPWVAHPLTWLLFSALFLMLVYPTTGLDQRLIAPYFDAAHQQFSLKHHWLLESILHNGLKYCLLVVALSTLLISLIGNLYAPYKAHQSRLLLVFVMMLTSTGLVALIKHNSMHGCPNDLIQYGGTLPYLQLFDALPLGTAMGKCFPGGHASGGFALMAFYIVFRDVEPKFSQAMLMLALSLGMVMGWAQMMRGEHFLSHTLWSGWLVWAICLACQRIWFLSRLSPNAVSKHSQQKAAKPIKSLESQ